MRRLFLSVIVSGSQRAIRLIAATSMLSTVNLVTAHNALAAYIDITGTPLSNSRFVGGAWVSGQSFVALDQYMNDFSFQVELRVGSPTQTFIPYVAAWDTNTGSITSIIWSGSATSLTTPVLNVPELVTFTTGSVLVNPGDSYIAFLTNTTPSGVDAIGIERTSNVYASGLLVQTSASSGLLPPIGQAWSNNQEFEDAIFTVNFSPTVSNVPITPALWLFGSGLLGLAGIARRKS